MDKVCTVRDIAFAHNAPVKADFPADLRLYRVALIGEWRERFAACLEDSGLVDIKIPMNLFPALFDEILGLVEGGDDDREPCSHRPPVVTRLAEFPANISVCLKLLYTGEATLRAFLLDRSEVFAAESEFDRECILWDLNKATHNLIHREIQGICEQSLRPITEISGWIEGHGDAWRQSNATAPAINFQT